MRFAESSETILARLGALRDADAPTHGGHVLSYVYDPGVAELDALAAEAVRMMQPVNGLDPTTVGSVAVLERELIGFTRELLNGDDDVVGTVTSGGTESCLLAVKTARDAWLAAHGAEPGTARPRLVALLRSRAGSRARPAERRRPGGGADRAPRRRCRARRRLGALLPARGARPRCRGGCCG